jgi:hypothetical protein
MPGAGSTAYAYKYGLDICMGWQDNSVVLERMQPYEPLSDVRPRIGCLDYNSPYETYVLHAPYGCEGDNL